VEELRLNVPVIKEEDIYIAHSGETQVDVSRDPMRMIYDRSEPFYIPGNQTVIAVPFVGDAEFFRIQPQTYTLSPPRAEIGKGELLLTYVRTDQNAEAIKGEYQRTVNSIKDYLRSLSESAAQFNNQLEGLARSQLKARKDRLLADAGMTAALGLPMKKTRRRADYLRRSGCQAHPEDRSDQGRKVRSNRSPPSPARITRRSSAS